MIELMSHNRKAVGEITEAFNEGKRHILYVSGVGTGKSFVFMGLAESMLNKDDRILYIVPRYTIRNNLMAYSDFSILNEQVDFATFNYFTNKEKGMKKLSQYDFIVVDEAHHLWSDKYGNAITECMKELTNKYFLGLTATPERDITVGGHRVNVSTDSIFQQTVNGITNFEAIALGLMPTFNYRLLLPEKDPDQLKKDYDNMVDITVDYTDCENTLTNIVSIYQRKKWIAYFPDKKRLHENESLIRKVFTDYEIFILYADLHNLDEVLDGVKKAEKAIVLSVDMLLEGVHLSGITGIVLFRNVTSLVTFQQIDRKSVV